MAPFRRPIDLVKEKQTKAGLWLLPAGYAGKKFFALEKTGKPSRWNTLRALRVLRWFEK